MRKTLKPLLLATAAGLGLMAGTVAASAETLADALVSAYRNSHLLENYRATLAAADEDVAQSVAALRPVVQWGLDFATSRCTYPSTATCTSDWTDISATLAVSASWTLYDFGRTQLSIGMQKETVLATREALRSTEQDVLLSAVQAYADAKATAEQVAINQNSVRVISEQLKAAQDRFDVGEVTRTDVSQAEASLAGARASLAAAEGNYKAAREAYKAAIGHYPTRLSALPRAPSLPKSVEAASTTALRQHPTIKQLQHQVAVTDLAVSLADAQRLPTITGSLSFSDQDGVGHSGAAGVSIGQTIYSGGNISSLRRQAVIQREGTRASLRQAGVSVAQGVANAYAMIEVYRAQIRAYDQQIQAADIAYRGVREEATLGARTTLDVLDAEQDLLDARASRITAEADLQVAYYQLLSAMGLLTVEDLKLGIPTYDPAAYYNAVQNAPLSVQGERLDRVLRAIGKQ
ncbi:outer membrane protein [Rhodobacter aestuarii]|uniref:Outer membrane protein n=1 Tax=Rhodobacter aestuarii TaxID=453582 RepID=A0A1N7K3K4_9RHOB|nr:MULTISPECIES: TolC family outer membrane protein [Rhodobacter]PTV95872.1 outer membrane protein [Rhodobacter aestuarii]SIS56150.1 outer membrane protein [Rhodobacter aestuarii]SOC11172.1 outer membrane protein [Rhodobacter sp. JA431]